MDDEMTAVMLIVAAIVGYELFKGRSAQYQQLLSSYASGPTAVPNNPGYYLPSQGNGVLIAP